MAQQRIEQGDDPKDVATSVATMLSICGRSQTPADFVQNIQAAMAVTPPAVTDGQNPNDVNELADMAHLSLVTFNRHFKKAFGETAARWLEKRRAEDLLREIQLTRKTFAEIALEFRFSSPAYLTTFCKRHFGKTPKQLRTDFLSGKMPPDV